MFYLGIGIGVWTGLAICAVLFIHGARKQRESAERMEQGGLTGVKA